MPESGTGACGFDKVLMCLVSKIKWIQTEISLNCKNKAPLI
jgi:hypothetical protein